jgi:hypothetical protein
MPGLGGPPVVHKVTRERIKPYLSLLLFGTVAIEAVAGEDWADLTFKERFCLGICQSRKRHPPEQSNGMAKPQDHLKKKETGRILFHRRAAAAGSLRSPEPFPIVLLR